MDIARSRSSERLAHNLLTLPLVGSRRASWHILPLDAFQFRRERMLAHWEPVGAVAGVQTYERDHKPIAADAGPPPTVLAVATPLVKLNPGGTIQV